MFYKKNETLCMILFDKKLYALHIRKILIDIKNILIYSGYMTFTLWFAILLIIFAIMGFMLFIICGFLFLVWLIFREKPRKYTENYDNCPYKIEKD